MHRNFIPSIGASHFSREAKKGMNNIKVPAVDNKAATKNCAPVREDGNWRTQDTATADNKFHVLSRRQNTLRILSKKEETQAQREGKAKRERGRKKRRSLKRCCGGKIKTNYTNVRH